MTPPRKGDRYLWDSRDDGRIVVEVRNVRNGKALLAPVARIAEWWTVTQPLPFPESFRKVAHVATFR